MVVANAIIKDNNNNNANDESSMVDDYINSNVEDAKENDNINNNNNNNKKKKKATNLTPDDIIEKIDFAIKKESDKTNFYKDYKNRIFAEINYLEYKQILIQIIIKLELPTNTEGVLLLKGKKYSPFVMNFITDYLTHKNIR
jgi:hypothetical protein